MQRLLAIVLVSMGILACSNVSNKSDTRTDLSGGNQVNGNGDGNGDGEPPVDETDKPPAKCVPEGVTNRDGRDGLPGASGPAGRNGVDGSPGQDGAPGAPGQPGAPGHDGSPGRDGRDGLYGRDGRDGRDGMSIFSSAGAPVRPTSVALFFGHSPHDESKDKNMSKGFDMFSTVATGLAALVTAFCPLILFWLQREKGRSVGLRTKMLTVLQVIAVALGAYFFGHLLLLFANTFLLFICAFMLCSSALIFAVAYAYKTLAAINSSKWP